MEDEEERIKAFGCKLYLFEVVNCKSAGGEKLLKNILYKVNGRDFVKINDVPYLPPEEK